MVHTTEIFFFFHCNLICQNSPSKVLTPGHFYFIVTKMSLEIMSQSYSVCYGVVGYGFSRFNQVCFNQLSPLGCFGRKKVTRSNQNTEIFNWGTEPPTSSRVHEKLSHALLSRDVWNGLPGGKMQEKKCIRFFEWGSNQSSGKISRCIFSRLIWT